ncbi:MAG: 50S ribosomal protein L11 methyltransferase, partial [Granulosicoccus sp.]
MSNDWLEVLVDCETGKVEDIETWLFTAGALSVTLRDRCRDEAIEHAVLEPAPGEVRLWDVLTVVGLFAQSESVESVKDALYLTAKAMQTEPPAFKIDVLQDKPWERVWLERFKPMQFGERFWLCPRQAEIVDPAAVTLRLDPGLAFGTGTH